MNWLKRLFGKRKSAPEQENTPTPAAPATDSAPATAEKPAPSTTESAPEAATDTAAPEAADTEATAAPEPAVDTATPAAPEPAAADVEPTPESTSEPATAESEPAPAADPAMSVLDDVERAAKLQTATPAGEGPYGPASAKPASDGAPPSAEFTIKGKESSKLFHTEESPYFGRTKADVWFKSPADAESAGFTAYTRKKATAKK